MPISYKTRVKNPRPLYKTAACERCGRYGDLSLHTFKRGMKRLYLCKRCIKIRNIRDNYGIQPDEYEEVWGRQEGMCGICGMMEGADSPGSHHKKVVLAVDIVDGKFIGLVCMPCKALLSMSGRDPFRLQRALNYVRGA